MNHYTIYYRQKFLIVFFGTLKAGELILMQQPIVLADAVKTAFWRDSIPRDETKIKNKRRG